jgi:hypothetical protein
MTYLDLINAVLIRLREAKADVGNVDSNPYYAAIGSFVNDAKQLVEDTWDWSALRGSDSIMITQGQSIIQLPNSQNTNYNLFSVLNASTGLFLSQVTDDEGFAVYQDDLSNPVAQGSPNAWFHYDAYWNPSSDADSSNGLQQIRLVAPSDASYTLKAFRACRQAPLTQWDQRLKVPAAPVYTLATALASRERGEVSGTPTSELFAVAKTTLSDAIAIDSAKYPEELIWYVPSNVSSYP